MSNRNANSRVHQETEQFNTENISELIDSQPGEVRDEHGRFQSDSLTATSNPYRRLTSRRDVPESVSDRAGLALTCLVLKHDDDHDGRNERVVICNATPQWVSDLVNRSTGPSGLTKKWRQRFVYESLRMINATSPPSVAESDDLEKLREWEDAKGKRSYVERARKMLGSFDEETLLSLAQKIERWEVYMQVYDGLVDAGYDGRLYDMRQLKGAHRVAETPAQGLS
jgi:hypothetical protein